MVSASTASLLAEYEEFDFGLDESSGPRGGNCENRERSSREKHATQQRFSRKNGRGTWTAGGAHRRALSKA